MSAPDLVVRRSYQPSSNRVYETILGKPGTPSSDMELVPTERALIALQYRDQEDESTFDVVHNLFRLTASDAPCVFGFGRTSRHALYVQKVTGIRPNIPDWVQDSMDKGKEDEQVLVEQLAETLDNQGPYTIFKCGTFYLREDPRIGASPDRRIWDHIRSTVGMHGRTRMSLHL